MFWDNFTNFESPTVLFSKYWSNVDVYFSFPQCLVKLNIIEINFNSIKLNTDIEFGSSNKDHKRDMAVLKSFDSDVTMMSYSNV